MRLLLSSHQRAPETSTQETIFESRFSSREHRPEVEASCQVSLHLLYFLERSLDFWLVFAGTEA